MPQNPTDPAAADPLSAAAFIERWRGVRASELSTAQSFVIGLCDWLGVPPPHAKGFDDGLLRARSQGEAYARALPAVEGRPPFVLVVDVGTVIEVYAEFSRSGGTYTPFPDPRSHRIALADLARPDIRQRLRLIWTEPERLNPARISAEVTRDVAALLAALANSLETDPATPVKPPFQPNIQSNQAVALVNKALVAPETVAAFLTRCLFSMFAEDVELLPKGAFLGLLNTYRDDPATLQHMLRILWADMDTGGFSAALAKPVLHFNGKLFKQPHADGYSLLLNTKQIDLLIQAAQANWREVEPAIFGTLLERALNGKAQAAKLLEARAEVKKFHHQLCSIRVLDPACGSGNFLYVTLEHLKRLEGEVINQLEALGQTQDQLGFEGETVTLQQLCGIELNQRAAALAELVLWIGFLQWHYRNSRKAVWPQADFIVGNPPFIGAASMRAALGDGYVQTLLATSGDLARELAAPPTCDSQVILASHMLIRDYRNGSDLTDAPRGVKVIDAFGLSAAQLRSQYPAVFQSLLTRLVALNAQRATAEAQGTVRWLRPAFQDPVQRQQQTEMLLNKELLTHERQALEADFSYKTGENTAQPGQAGINDLPNDKNATPTKADSRSAPQPWPSTLPEQVKAVVPGKKPCQPCLKHSWHWAGRSTATHQAWPSGAMPEGRCGHLHT